MKKVDRKGRKNDSFLARVQVQSAGADEGEGRVSQHRHHSEEQAKLQRASLESA